MRKLVSLQSSFLLVFIVAGCGPIGKSSDEGDLEKIDHLQKTGNSSNAEGGSDTSEIGNAIAAKSTADGCTVDLIQDVTISQNDGKLQGMYSARIPKYADCAGTDKSAVLYISSPGDFNKPDDKYGCKVVGGTFAIRCYGPEVKISSTGHFQITISGGKDFNPDLIKMRMTYEKRN